MSKREAILALLLAVAATMVVVGAAQLAEPVAWILGGLLLAVWSWLILADIPAKPEAP
jgi:hypothetical protein